MKLIYVVREAELQDIDEIQTIMRRRQKKFMSRLTISLILSNWYLTFKYFAIGAFACLNFESIAPIFPCVIVVPIFLLIEVIYSFIVTRFSMKASMKTIDKRVREGTAISSHYSSYKDKSKHLPYFYKQFFYLCSLLVPLF